MVGCRPIRARALACRRPVLLLAVLVSGGCDEISTTDAGPPEDAPGPVFDALRPPRGDARPADAAVDAITAHAVDGFVTDLRPDAQLEDAASADAFACGGAWWIETVDPGQGVGEYAALAVIDDVIHIAYYDAIHGDLKHAERASLGDPWVLEVVDSAGDVGAAVAAASAASELHLVYRDHTHAGLRYALRAGGSWHTSAVDDVGDVGYFPDVDVDGTTVRASYFDATLGRLRVATRDAAGSWNREVAGALGGGWYTALSHQDGEPVVLNHGWYGGDLRASVRTAGTWSEAVLAAGPGVGQQGDLVVDADGSWHMVYRRSSSASLWYGLRRPDGVFFEMLIDGSADVGVDASMALDSSGTLHVAYYDASAGDLKYARRAPSGTWKSEVVASAGDVGRQASIAVDDSLNLHIAFYDRSARVLKYAYRCP